MFSLFMTAFIVLLVNRVLPYYDLFFVEAEFFICLVEMAHV